MLTGILFLCCICFANQAAAQSKVAVQQPNGKNKYIELKHATVLRYDKSLGINAKRLIGDVICEHEGAVMRCDSAYLYDDRKLEAFGHISVIKGDSIFVYGDKLFYDSGTKLATLEKNVRCIEKDMTLTTDLMTYDVANSVANYYNGGTIVNKENTLKSKNGHYYSASKELTFHYDVELKNPSYTMRSDTLRYNTSSKVSYFLGPSIIMSKQNYIYCENGFYDTEHEYSRFSTNAIIVTKDQKLTGDSIYYDRKKGFGKAMKNITIIDTTNKSIITGNYAEHYEQGNRAIVTDKAVYARIIEKDTMFMAADTLQYAEPDSTHSYVRAHRHVRIFKKDLQGMCDSLNYSLHDSLMRMYNSPVLWAGQGQVTAKQIDVVTGQHSVKSFLLNGNAILIQKADSLDEEKFNQVAGRKIEGFFANDTLRKINVVGNAQIVYYVKQKKKISGVNKTNCSELTMWFGGDEGMDRTTFRNKPESVALPLAESDDRENRLKGFIWLENKRPKSKMDLFTVH
ncbi:MAG: organic solvent tolerance protein OstA [Bacteroidetes bacterium]|nr:organic solvent tolerance protein OstA [Bacteroidota bacterium]